MTGNFRGSGRLAALAFVLLFIPLRIQVVRAGLKNSEEPEGLLTQIKTRIAERLARLPNYTCREIVERMSRRASGGGLEHVDRVEFDVAFVDHAEIFARPGAARFEETSISKIVNTWTIGDGAFASHASALFEDDIATFKYAGRCKKDAHITQRYDFQVPQEKSRFLLKHGSAEGFIAYKGSFWADADTLDLVRLELKVDRIPAHIGIRSVYESMRYTTVQIKDAEYMLPSKSEMATSDDVGNYRLNRISFAACREFKGESVVTYGAPVDSTSVGSAAPRDR